MNEEQVDEATLFPEAACAAALGELSAWTSVQDCMAAARCLEGRPAAGDVFDSKLIAPFADDDGIEAVLIRVLGWFIAGYRVPEHKIALAKALDATIRPATAETIRNARFKPNISVGPAGTIGHYAPALAEMSDRRFFVVVDKPFIVELIQTPLRCLTRMVHKYYESTRQWREIKTKALETSDKGPAIHHRPYADSPLPAVIEACCFHDCALDFGPIWGGPGHAFDVSFRAVNVIGVPPFDPKIIELAGKMSADMLAGLK